MTDRFSDNADRSRFELDVDGLIAFANYRRSPDALAILHVEAPPALRGTGAAGRLMEEVVAVAEREGVGITPFCGYAARWLRQHRR